MKKMAFDPTNQQVHFRLFSALFPQVNTLPTMFTGLRPPPEPSDSEIEYLEKLKDSSRVDDESVTYRNLELLRAGLPSQVKREEFVSWLVESRFRAFVWNGFLVILNADVSEIREVLGPITQVRHSGGA